MDVFLKLMNKQFSDLLSLKNKNATLIIHFPFLQRCHISMGGHTSITD